MLLRSAAGAGFASAVAMRARRPRGSSGHRLSDGGGRRFVVGWLPAGPGRRYGCCFNAERAEDRGAPQRSVFNALRATRAAIRRRGASRFSARSASSIPGLRAVGCTADGPDAPSKRRSVRPAKFRRSHTHTAILIRIGVRPVPAISFRDGGKRNISGAQGRLQGLVHPPSPTVGRPPRNLLPSPGIAPARRKPDDRPDPAKPRQAA